MSITEAEWRTRKERIDPKLDAAGWKRPRAGTAPATGSYRTEEEETAKGPADYALWLDRGLVGVVEAKRVGLDPQEVLRQSERYAAGAGSDVSFLYSTNGEKIFFLDARHPLNLSRRIAAFHQPAALRELLGRDFDAACTRLLAAPHDHRLLRPYQKEANAAVERAIVEHRRRLLVAMATGTGKTYTLVNQIYRLMKAGVARRILFLVDRRALAAQAVRAFATFEVEPNRKFDQVYEVYSSRFQRDDFEEGEAFDPKVLPQRYLTDPQPSLAFVYVCTIQRMAINILGRNAIFGLGDEELDSDASKLDIPIHAFDLVVADECHRGYTAQEESVWRSTLDHFDAVTIGLTATPAQHTTAYFRHKAFEYRYEDAVRDGYLVDYDVVNVRSEVRMNGVFLKEGENVEVVDPSTGLSRLDQLEDERQFDTADIEARVTAPESNRKILEEVAKHAAEHETRYNRFPKMLIFAVNDLPHTSHADQLVRQAREVFGRGEGFVQKITGKVDRPLQRIREFRNRPTPAVAVTVDLLSTGVDLPDLEFIVLLRPVKSRILFTQMLGRGTRPGEKLLDKSHFTVFDCFDGTLLAYFRETTDLTGELPAPPTRTIQEIIDDIWSNRDRDYNIGCLIKRLQRIDKEMAGAARALFAAFLPDGDVGQFARGLRQGLRADFAGTMKVLRDPVFQRLLVEYPRRPRIFLSAYDYHDEVTSRAALLDSYGRELKPEDYLATFARFVCDNRDKIHAIQILLDRPREWRASALAELRARLLETPYRFTPENLRRAHTQRYQVAADLISMVRHAADEESPLLTAEERVARAFQRVRHGKAFTVDEEQWLGRIRYVMETNLSIDREDFEEQGTLVGAGGWGAARRAFGEAKLSALLLQLNEAIAA